MSFFKTLGKVASAAGTVAVVVGAAAARKTPQILGEVVKRAPETLGQHAKRTLKDHSDKLTDEQKAQAREVSLRGEEAKRARVAAERAEKTEGQRPS